MLGNGHLLALFRTVHEEQLRDIESLTLSLCRNRPGK